MNLIVFLSATAALTGLLLAGVEIPASLMAALGAALGWAAKTPGELVKG